MQTLYRLRWRRHNRTASVESFSTMRKGLFRSLQKATDLEISVIVPVYNGGQFLRRCLGAITTSDFAPLEVLVVDDGSTDESAAISREFGATVLTTASARSGPAAARNLAARTAKGKVLLFVDADVVLKQNTISLIADRFTRHPDISALFGSYDDEPAEQNFLSQYKNLQHHFVHQTSSCEASTFWSGLGAIRRDVFLEYGGFDCKKFAVPSIEDIDLGLRLRQGGHRILLDRNIQAKHLKKWEIISHLRTEIFCRALPWSRLIIQNKRLINDMNLKTTDRISAMLVALSLITLPIAFWKPGILLLTLLTLISIAALNRNILIFFARKKGFVFATATFPWQLLYFFYSGIVFVGCWVRYSVVSTAAQAGRLLIQNQR